MRITYDPQVDVLRIMFNKSAIVESEEQRPGVILDYDRDGSVVGLEILNASKHIENPGAVEYEVTSQVS